MRALPANSLEGSNFRDSLRCEEMDCPSLMVGGAYLNAALLARAQEHEITAWTDTPGDDLGRGRKTRRREDAKDFLGLPLPVADAELDADSGGALDALLLVAGLADEVKAAVEEEMAEVELV